MHTMAATFDVMSAAPRHPDRDDARRHRVPMLTIASARFRGLIVISAAGDVKQGTVPLLRAVLRRAARAGCNIVLDLSRITVFDRTAFRACLTYRRSCERHHRVLVLAHPAPAVRHMVKALDVHGAIPLFRSAGAASRAVLKTAKRG
jgi:anti-anti-sigma factor